MKQILGVLGSALLMWGCAHKPPAQEAVVPTPRTPAQASYNNPLDEQFFGGSNVVSDQYGDTEVVYCDENVWALHHDPNKAGKAMAKAPKGRPVMITEIAPFYTGPMKVKWKNGAYQLTGKTRGHKIVIKPLDDGNYSIAPVGFRRETVLIQQTRALLEPEVIETICREKN